MKIYFTYLAVLLTGFILAQNTNKIAEAEKKAYKRSLSSVLTQRTDSPEVIDIYQYDLYFDINPGDSGFSGTSISYFTALEDTSQVTLDANSTMTINEVKYNGNVLTTYTHSSDELTINLPSELTEGAQGSIEVSYTAMYSNSKGISKETHNGESIVSTLSESFDASGWWIGKDNLNDKAERANIYITHPSDLKAGSNGTLQSVTDLGNGNVQTYWKHDYPITAYLISLCVTNYVEYSTTANVGGQSVPVISYIYPEYDTSSTHAQLDAVPSYIEYISELVGDYPYKDEKYGHCQWEWGGGMEHATMSSQDDFETYLNIHELAHQWFGDKITCATWSDIWLNEGFATYFEGVVQTHLYGDDYFSSWREGRVNYITLLPGGSVYIPEDESMDENRIFNHRLSYYKGAMVLNMLRFRLGDEVFFNTLKNYLEDPNLAYSFANTENLKNHFETESGEDLDEFFADWVYGEGYPIFSVDFSSGETQGTLTVSQTSSHSSVDLFETHFSVEFTGTNGATETRTFFMNQAQQSFSITGLPFTVASYQFNPKYNIICNVENQTMGVEDVVINNKTWDIYPNPAQSLMAVVSNELIDKIEVYNLVGAKLMSKQINNRETNLFVGELEPGVYIVKALINGVWYAKKLVKK